MLADYLYQSKLLLFLSTYPIRQDLEKVIYDLEEFSGSCTVHKYKAFNERGTCIYVYIVSNC